MKKIKYRQFLLSVFVFAVVIFIYPLPNDSLSQVTDGKTVDVVAAPGAEFYVRKAIELKLYEDRYWYVLMHYQKKIFGTESLIDDRKFFLAKNGKKDPKAELESTIRYLFSSPGEDGVVPACRFPGRYAWLKEKLGIDESAIPGPVCKKIDDTIATVNPTSMTLIFPVGYMGSPASMYGHTFLLVESEGKSRLMSFAVNYQARATDKFGFTFAFKGLFGFYQGYYDVLPYYEKVKEYSDIDKRDIWEYPLNLNKKEIVKLMKHLFELNEVYSNYYFLDENCSYNLLFLLEAARPSLHLTDSFGPFITPVDTIRAVIDSGITEKPAYRPSKLSKLKHLSSLLKKGELQLVKDIAAGRERPESIMQLNAPLNNKIAAADLLCDYLQYSYIEGTINQKRYAKMIIPALQTRSSLGPATEELTGVTQPLKAETGHLPYRMSAYATMRFQDSELYPIYHITWRPTYHTLLDRDEGFNLGSEIVFLNIDASFNQELMEFMLHRFDLIYMASLNPITWYSRQLSWKIKTGLIQKFGSDLEEHLLYDFDTSFGLTANAPLLGLTYLMANFVVDIGPSREHWVNMAAGLNAGFVQRIASFLKIHYSARCIYYCVTERNLLLETSCANNLIITANTGITAEYVYRFILYPFRSERMFDMHELTLGGYVFF